MKKMSKKALSVWLAFLLTLMSVISLIPTSVYAANISENEFASKIANLQKSFVDGKYWNFYNSGDLNRKITPDKTGDTICPSCSKTRATCHGDCSDNCGKFYLNGQYYGGQCYGYANMIAYKVFGSPAVQGGVAQAGWEKITSVSNYQFRAGDYVRVKNDGHSVFITKVTSDKIYYTDCNWSGPCMVKWDQHKDLSVFRNWTTYVCHYSGNNLSGTGTPINGTTNDSNTNNNNNSGSGSSNNVALTKDTRYPTPITCYPLATSGKITVYARDLTAYSISSRYISYNDQCTITEVYTNGYCHVTYPSGNKTAEAYAKTASFFYGNVSPYSWTASETKDSYIRSDLGTKIGSVTKGDVCTVVGNSGNKLQLIYPLTGGGYKLGWINSASTSSGNNNSGNNNSGNTNSGSSVSLTKDNRYPVPIVCYPMTTSGKLTLYSRELVAYALNTRYIAYNDKCTINEVYTNGYCSVTYPSGNKTNTELARVSDFMAGNAGPYTWTASAGVKSYVRSDLGTQFGSVSAGDVCTVVGQSGDKLQVIYPTSSGYKLGWIRSAGSGTTTNPDPVVTPINQPTSNDHNLKAAVDAIEGGSNYVNVRGWAFDADDMEAEIFVHVYIGGIAGDPNAEATAIVAREGGRSDVDSLYHCGDHHAYYANVTTSKRGTQPIYLYAIDCRDPAASICIGSGTVEIGGNGNGGDNIPMGVVDEVTPGDGYVYVRGWAFDRDNCDHSIFVHVYIGGVVGDPNAEGHAIVANVLRQDVDDVHHCGAYHGFSAKISTKKRGNQEIHFYAINIDGGSESPCIGDHYTGNITSESEKPTFEECYIADKSNEGYRIYARPKDNVGIDRVTVATWSNPNQTDIQWTDMTNRGDGVYYLDRKRSDFEVNGNAYLHNHVFAVDYSGNEQISVQSVDYKVKNDYGRNVNSGAYRIVSALNPERAVDVYGGGTYNSANVQLYSNLEFEQIFDIEYTENGFYKIVFKLSQKALDVAGCGYLPKTNVLQYTSSNTSNQEWVFVEVMDGYYAIVSRYNGLALTVEDGVDANGTNICVDTLTYDNSQLWKLRRVIDDSMVVVNDVTAYEGGEVLPSVSVISTDDLIIENLDYSVETNIEGTVGTVTVTGKNRFCDSVTKTFNITYIEAPVEEPTEEPTEPVDPSAPSFRISQVAGKPGSEVSVDISIENNPGITSFNYVIEYPDELTLTGVEYHDLFSSKATGSSRKESPFIMSWFSTNSADENANGVIATMKFTINITAEGGIYPITLTYDSDNVFNSEFDNQFFAIVDGGITVKSTIPGDINGDTKVNMKDIVLLQQYLNGWNVAIDEAAANVNGDSTINMKDIVLLQQYLNGWEVVLK